VTRTRAAVLPRPGSADEPELRQVKSPAPGDRAVLTSVRAATVTRGDVALRRVPRLKWPLVRIGKGLRRKRILGHEFAGEWQVSVALVGRSGESGTTA
jgi:NADPH:quinone reductase-like Zn-dependent oxidoreductase